MCSASQAAWWRPRCPLAPGLTRSDSIGWYCDSGTHNWSNIVIHENEDMGSVLNVAGTCEITCTGCTIRSARGQPLSVSDNGRVTFVDSTLQGEYTVMSLLGRGEITLRGSHVESQGDFIVMQERGVFNTANTTYQTGTYNRSGRAVLNDQGGNTGLAAPP